MKNLRFVIWICVIIASLGFTAGCLEEVDNEEADFAGTYNVTGTETVNSKSSQITDTIKVSQDTADNLSIKTQNFGTFNATITSKHSFRIDKQEATVKTDSGKVNVTIEGKGDVSAGLLDISGSYSVNGQIVTFHLSGFRM
ncbi:hypothetical protein FJZ31_04700 [Candidatus Poribacteria bacterium]|nr:hypothetical protein [Candidatus Poribacteria bacterium]